MHEIVREPAKYNQDDTGEKRRGGVHFDIDERNLRNANREGSGAKSWSIGENYCPINRIDLPVSDFKSE